MNEIINTYESNLSALLVNSDFYEMLNKHVVATMVEEEGRWYIVHSDGTKEEATLKPLPRTKKEALGE